MLNRLDLKYFKCFEVLHLRLAPLTLLSGGNASGKSSTLQSIVLIHQTIREHEWSTRLMLNGDAIRLGTVTDVVDQLNGRFSFEIGFADDQSEYHWTFSGERSEMSMAVEKIVAHGISYDRPSRLRHLLPPKEGPTTTSIEDRLRHLTYITAERIGPRETYALVDRQSAPVVGAAGEYAASVLHLCRDEHVSEVLALPELPNTLLRQVEGRMKQFFPGCGFVLQQIPQTNAVTLGLRTSEATEFHRPINVGFGLTQVFPIIVAALSAGRGDIILIENPEVHLHPAGQSLMGQFLADVANSGVQVILETHSDHVLNGVRRSVRSGKLNPEQIAIHFFRPLSDKADQVLSPQIDMFGNMDAWPEGFFDQFDKDANYFAGWGD